MIEFNFIEANGIRIAEIISEETEIKNTQDAVDIMMNCIYQGADCIIIRKQNLVADFFDLKNGIPGDILQKFSTYNAKLAIVGDFNNIASKSLRDFIYESNKIGRINFVSSTDLAAQSFIALIVFCRKLASIIRCVWFRVSHMKSGPNACRHGMNDEW